MRTIPLLHYPGAKWKNASWIVSFMPYHHSYLEPYCGSAAVLFNKAPAPMETINDLDNEIPNLFRVVRNAPEELARMVYLTPYSRSEYDNAYLPGEDDDELEQARKFLIRCWQGHGFRTNKYKVGWKNDVQGREKAYAVRNWNRVPEAIMQCVERLREVQVENKPALEVIERFNFPNVLIYADPPYLLSTRSGPSYRHEMTEQAHVELLEALLQHKGMVILSGYDNELYNEMLGGWEKESTAALAEHGKKRTECLWMNFPYQMKL